MDYSSTGSEKLRLRTALLTARTALSEQERLEISTGLEAGLSQLIGTMSRGETVCAFIPAKTEPGPKNLIEMLRFAQLCILLPVAKRSSPLLWMVDGSDIEHRKGSFGVAEPIGDPLPESTIRDATTILVPALAIDREGRRLGRGGGHYDRSLPLANPNTRRVAIVRDEEFVDHLRTEPHDFRVTGVITPTRGYVEL